MTIFKKDGSIYKFSGPNKLMMQQDLWKNYKTHNMHLLSKYLFLNEEKSHYNNVLDLTTKKPEKEIVHQEEVKIEEKPEEKLIIPQEINKPEVIIQPEPEVKKETKSKFRKTIAHCLIAKVKEKVDDLYGDINKKITYSDTFTVEIIILDLQDLNMKLFTTYEDFSLDTILYPQDMQKRWWQIINISQNEKGYFVDCIPSKLQPNFSKQ